MHKLDDSTVNMFTRLNILFILDKFCILTSERQKRQRHRFNGNGNSHHNEAEDDHDQEQERLASLYDLVYTRMQSDVAKYVYLVLEMEAPPRELTKPPNGNAHWAKRIIRGWKRRELFPSAPLTEIEERIDLAAAVEETPDDPHRPTYDDEKLDRRMDADRERQKKDKEDVYVQRAQQPLHDVQDDWFLTMPPESELDVSEYWASARPPFSDAEFACMETENAKYAYSSNVELYEPRAPREAQSIAPPMPPQRSPPPLTGHAGYPPYLHHPSSSQSSLSPPYPGYPPPTRDHGRSPSPTRYHPYSHHSYHSSHGQSSRYRSRSGSGHGFGE
ncbi:hypothetical protein DFJ77DRAFT_158869 [Powellomyces hirtus]|nr:hypothetical protein DFJ77DRAFT_158869 [Powellomyces hirtus]